MTTNTILLDAIKKLQEKQDAKRRQKIESINAKEKEISAEQKEKLTPKRAQLAQQEQAISHSGNLADIGLGALLAAGQEQDIKAQELTPQQKLELAKQYTDQLEAYTQQVQQNEAYHNIFNEWVDQNRRHMQEILKQSPTMTARQLQRSLQPFFEQLGDAVGEDIEVLDYNKETGNVTFTSHSTGLTANMNLFRDAYPEMQADHNYARGLVITDEDIYNEARKRQEQEDARQQTNDYYENRMRNINLAIADERLKQLKQSGQPTELTQEEQELQKLGWTSDYERLYETELKSAPKQLEQLNATTQELEQEKGEYISQILPVYKELDHLRQEIDNLPEKDKQIFLSNGQFSQAVRETILDNKPILSTLVTTGFHVSKQAEQILRKIDNAKNVLTAQLVAKLRKPIVGGGVTSDADMKIVQNAIPSIFGSQEGFKTAMGQALKVVLNKMQYIQSALTKIDTQKQQILPTRSQWLQKRLVQQSITNEETE